MSMYVSVIDGMTNATDDDLTAFQTDFLLQAGVVQRPQYTTPLKVTASGTPDTNSNVAAGVAYIPNSVASPTQFYQVLVDATETQAHDATTSNPRIDAVVLFIEVSGATSPDADASNIASIEIVKGTEAGSPTAPSDGDIDSALGASTWIRLADIAIANPFVSISSGDITDYRPYAYINAAKIVAEYNQNAYGFMDSSGVRKHYKIFDTNGNILCYSSSGTLAYIYVPITGSIQQAINDAAGSCPIYLSPGTHTPSDQINVNVTNTTIIGAGISVTTISGSANNTGSNEGVLTTTADNVSIEELTVAIAGTATQFGVEVDRGSSDVNDFYLRAVEITGADTGKVGLSFRGANDSFNCKCTDIKITGSGTGQGMDINTTSRSFFTNMLIDVDSGTHWDLDANSDYNRLDLIVRTAGTNNGIGNSVDEVVY